MNAACKGLWFISICSLSRLARGLKNRKVDLNVKVGVTVCLIDGDPPASQPQAIGQPASGVGANGRKSLTSFFTVPFTYSVPCVSALGATRPSHILPMSHSDSAPFFQITNSALASALTATP